MQRSESIRDVIQAAVDRVVKKVTRDLQRGLAAAGRGRVAAARRTPGVRHRRRPGELTRWVADNRARRVPTFVIEATGLDTKKKIVARFGPNVTFEKGRPLPPALAASAESRRGATPAAAGAVKARPPAIRKAAATV